RRHRSRVPARLHVRGRHDASRRRAGAGRRHRRGARREVPVRSSVSTGQPAARWDGALMVTRRQVLKSLAAAAAFQRMVNAAASIRYGYAAITWGNDYMTAINEIAAVGFRGVQLRAGDGLLDRFGAQP